MPNNSRENRSNRQKSNEKTRQYRTQNKKRKAGKRAKAKKVDDSTKMYKPVENKKTKKVKKEKMSFLQAVKAGVFTVPGDGMIDYAPLFAILAEQKYAGWFIVEAEQDPALANPLEYAIKARKYIGEKTGL